MAQKAKSISNGKSKNLSAKSKSNLKISRSLFVSQSNLRKTKSVTITHENFTSKKVPKDDLCTHCGVRKKGPDFRFLCRYCFRKAGEEPVFSINSATMSKDMFSKNSLGNGENLF
jgi:ribosomal protein S14